MAMTNEATALARVEAAHRALTEARTLPDVQRIRDVAETLRTLARQAKLSLETQNMAAELRIRAERKSGELLREMPPGQGRRTDLEEVSADTTPSAMRPPLAELGISRDQSSAWQKIADIPADRFEEHIDQTKAAGDELTTAGVLRLAEEVREEEARVIDVQPREVTARAPRAAEVAEAQAVADQLVDLAGDPHGRIAAAKERERLSTALVTARRAWLSIDPASVWAIAAGSESVLWESFAIDARKWLEAFEAARPVGLRLVRKPAALGPLSGQKPAPDLVRAGRTVKRCHDLLHDLRAGLTNARMHGYSLTSIPVTKAAMLHDLREARELLAMWEADVAGLAGPDEEPQQRRGIFRQQESGA